MPVNPVAHAGTGPGTRRRSSWPQPPRGRRDFRNVATRVHTLPIAETAASELVGQREPLRTGRNPVDEDVGVIPRHIHAGTCLAAPHVTEIPARSSTARECRQAEPLHQGPDHARPFCAFSSSISRGREHATTSDSERQQVLEIVDHARVLHSLRRSPSRAAATPPHLTKQDEIAAYSEKRRKQRNLPRRQPSIARFDPRQPTTWSTRAADRVQPAMRLVRAEAHAPSLRSSPLFPSPAFPFVH